MAAPVLTQTKYSQISAFLDQRRFAAVGISRNPRDFSHALLREFERRGYEVVRVNPATSEIDGRRCFARVQDIEPPVFAALLLTAPASSEQVVRDCAAAGVRHIWMFRGGGTGAVSPKAVDFCRENGIDVIAGECPFMFLPKTGFVHRMHGYIRRILGTYPG